MTKSKYLTLPIVFAVALVCGAAVLMFWRGGIGAKQPNVIVILLDTLRADHLGVYGHERDTSPALDQFARENVVYMNAYTAAPWTPPSVASIFTGLYVSSHGMLPPNGREDARQTLTRLSNKLFTMSELLKAKGYNTAAISPNPWITVDFGYGQGFDSFTYTNRSNAADISERGLKVIDQLEAQGAPFFLYLHFLDPHTPYAPPAHLKERFSGGLKRASYDEKNQRDINLYDAEIVYLDGELKKLFERLKAESWYDDSLIVIVGDHGEQFGERGHSGHGFGLYNEEVKVPLIVKPPGKPLGRKVEHLVSTIDILPTVLSLTGAQPPGYLPGVSLFNEQAIQARRGVMMEIKRVMVQRAYINAEGKKLIVGSTERKKAEELDHSAADDPTKAVIGVYESFAKGIEGTTVQDEGLLRELQSELVDSIQLAMANRQGGEGASAEVNDATIEQLKSLGYLK